MNGSFRMSIFTDTLHSPKVFPCSQSSSRQLLTPKEDPRRSEERRLNITPTCRVYCVLLFYYIFLTSICTPCRGIYSCFLGSQKTSETPYYFETPIFIYFQVYMIIILIMNIFYMGYTVKKIHEMLKHQEQMMYVIIFILVSISLPCQQHYQHQHNTCVVF